VNKQAYGTAEVQTGCEDLMKHANKLVNVTILTTPDAPTNIYTTDIINHCFMNIQNKNANFNQHSKYRNFISFQYKECLYIGFGLLSSQSTLTNTLYKIQDQEVHEVKVFQKKMPAKRSDMAFCLVDD